MAIDAAMPALHRPGRDSSGSRARKNAHSARAMVAVMVTSGIWMRVNRNNPTQVLSASPAYMPARCENAQVPMRYASQHSSMAESATGKRATKS